MNLTTQYVYLHDGGDYVGVFNTFSVQSVRLSLGWATQLGQRYMICHFFTGSKNFSPTFNLPAHFRIVRIAIEGNRGRPTSSLGIGDLQVG